MSSMASSICTWPTLISCRPSSRASQEEDDEWWWWWWWWCPSSRGLPIAAPAPPELLPAGDPEVALEHSSSLPYLGLETKVALPLRALGVSSVCPSSKVSFRWAMLSALPNLLRMRLANSRGFETTEVCVSAETPPLTPPTTPPPKPLIPARTLAPTSFSPCCMSLKTSLGCRAGPFCRTGNRALD